MWKSTRGSTWSVWVTSSDPPRFNRLKQKGTRMGAFAFMGVRQQTRQAPRAPPFRGAYPYRFRPACRTSAVKGRRIPGVVMPAEKIKSRNYKKDRMILQLDTERGRGAAWTACQPGALARSGCRFHTDRGSAFHQQRQPCIQRRRFVDVEVFEEPLIAGPRMLDIA